MVQTCTYEERKETDVSVNEAGKKAVEMFYQIKTGKYQADKINEFYNEMGVEGYDQWAKVVNFTEPYEIIKQVHASQEEECIQAPKDAKILDVGAGTGIIGRNLAKEGYTNMDALEASEDFQSALQSLGAYKEVHRLFMGQGVDVYPDYLKNQYDVVTASGVFMPDHMPKEGMDDIHASLKKGGYFVTAMRGTLYVNGEAQGYKDKIDELIAQGKFKLVREKRFMRGTSDGTGLYARMESCLVVLQKID